MENLRRVNYIGQRRRAAYVGFLAKAETAPQGQAPDAGAGGKAHRRDRGDGPSYETDIRLPSYEVMVRLADLFGVTVDYLLCRQDKRFLDISDLSEEEAALVCGMVELLKKKDGKK